MFAYCPASPQRKAREEDVAAGKKPRRTSQSASSELDSSPWLRIAYQTCGIEGSRFQKWQYIHLVSQAEVANCLASEQST